MREGSPLLMRRLESWPLDLFSADHPSVALLAAAAAAVVGWSFADASKELRIAALGGSYGAGHH